MAKGNETMGAKARLLEKVLYVEKCNISGDRARADEARSKTRISDGVVTE